MAYQDPSLASYHGSEPYIFISYSHRDMERASAIIRSMNRAGYRVWYDEGLIPGREWDENIARIIMGCGYFVALITHEYLASSNCKDELNYARDKNKPILLIYLDEVSLPAGMELRLGRLFAVHYNQYSVEDFYLKVFSADGLARCNRRTVPGSSAAPAAARSSSASRPSSGRTVKNQRTQEVPAEAPARAEPSSGSPVGKIIGILLILALLCGGACLLYYYFYGSGTPAPSAPPPPTEALESVVPSVSTEAELDIEAAQEPSVVTSPIIEPDPVLSPSPEVVSTPIPTEEPAPTVEPSSTPTPELTPAPTPTPTPNPTPETVQTPEPQLVDPTPTPTPTPATDNIVIVESGETTDSTVTVVPTA